MAASQSDLIARFLPELAQIEHLAGRLKAYGRVGVEATVACGSHQFPIHSFEFGPDDPTTPVFVLTGGVHGLERIGSRVIIEYLKSFLELLSWDSLLHHYLERCRILFVPLINPGGTYAKTRCNPAGVDLMRNAPIDALEPTRWVGGQRISAKLPWYRGALGEAMQPEAQMLCRLITERVFPARFAATLDVHSGFGRLDRLWFPFAHSKEPFPNLLEVFALKRKLDQALPNHVYQIEPQSLVYCTHGDLWDYLYLEYRKQNTHGIFLPLTLEMGSWLWVKKNPRQLFSMMGIFNPLLPHRTKRILRRHLNLIDCMMRLTASYERWCFPQQDKKLFYQEGARIAWYPNISA